MNTAYCAAVTSAVSMSAETWLKSEHPLVVCDYSLRSAVTGFFLAASLAGMNPPSMVSTTLIRISSKACSGFNWATLERSVSDLIIMFAGMVSR